MHKDRDCSLERELLEEIAAGYDLYEETARLAIINLIEHWEMVKEGVHQIEQDLPADIGRIIDLLTEFQIALRARYDARRGDSPSP